MGPAKRKTTTTDGTVRFVLANPDPRAPAVQAARSLAIAADHPAARRVAAQSHSDLLVLERTPGPTGALRTVITVDEVRRTVSFFGSTAGEGGWRVCVVDTADELQQPQASNAFVVGFLRRDYGAAGLYAMQRAGQLTPNQTVVALTVMTLFIPCIANFFVIVRERGAKAGAAIAVFIIVYAFGIGAALNAALKALGVSLG